MAEFTAADRVGSVGGYIGGITALSGMLGNLFGGTCGMSAMTGCGNGCSAANAPITRYEATLLQENAAKDSEISILKADKYTDQKLTEVYKDLNSQINTVKEIIQKNKDEQGAINMQQATYNGVNNAAIGCMQGQINQLLGITKLVVSNDSVCPGWGNVTITPASTTTTTTPAA